MKASSLMENFYSSIVDGKPPSLWLHSINAFLHKEPNSFLIHGLIWAMLLFFGGTFAAGMLLLVTVIRLLAWLSGWSQQDIVVSNNKAVIITGSDSGFGNDLAFALANLGFTVFCGCRVKDSFLQFQDHSNIHPIQMDVTKHDEVTAASKAVDIWLKESSEHTLHAVVNNAGVGMFALIDWMSDDLHEYKNDMEINFYGMVRTTKAFLPLLKRQVLGDANHHESTRIINMVSMAGLVAGPHCSTYHCSKFAAEAFSTCLRLEMKQIGIQVVTVNPSFHETPLTQSMGQRIRDTWEALPASTKEEYGEEYFNGVFKNTVDAPRMVMWEATIVQQEMLKAVLRKRPPSQMIVGADAMFVHMVLRMLPPWIYDHLMPPMFVQPAFCNKKKVD